MKLADGYRQITKCEVGNGSSILFWSDNWKSQLLQDSYPSLFSFAKDKLCSVKKALDSTDLEDAFHTPLSAQAMSELRQMQIVLNGIVVDPDYKDKGNLIGSKTSKCVPSELYKVAFQHIPNHFPSQWL